MGEKRPFKLLGLNQFRPSMKSVPTEITPIECNPESMSREQKRFFKYWIEELLNGRRVETEDPVTYAGIYLDILAERFIKNKNAEYFLGQIDNISKVYDGTENMESFVSRTKSDTYIFIGDYEKAWHFLRSQYRFTVRDVINIRGKCEDTTLTGGDLYKIISKSKSKLTNFGYKNFGAIVDDVSVWLEEAHLKDGRNILESYCRNFDFRNLTNSDLEKISESFVDPELFEYLKLQYRQDIKESLENTEAQRLKQLSWKYKKVVGMVNSAYNFLRFNRNLFGSSFYVPEPYIPSIVSVAIENQIGELFRASEDRLREKEGLPRIGEGWISETELFRKLQKQFPDEKIIKHAKPSWLTPQHIDIYLSKRNIGIEYQGVQHLKPVDYFGGLTAFEAQKVRDERKRLLCEQNGCSLIYVYESYDFSDVVRKMLALLNP